MERPCAEMPPHWVSYIEVDNVDSSLARALGLGAKVLLPATDIPTVGRIAVMADPEGSAIGIFQPEKK